MTKSTDCTFYSKIFRSVVKNTENTATDFCPEPPWHGGNAPGNNYRWWDHPSDWTRKADTLTHSSGFVVRFLVRGEAGYVKLRSLKLPHGAELKIMTTPDALKQLKSRAKVFSGGGSYKDQLCQLVSEAGRVWRYEAAKRS